MEKKEYKFECTNILIQEDLTFVYNAENIKDAVKALVGTFEKDFNPANIEFDAVYENGEDLGADGLLDAETALAEYYT